MRALLLAATLLAATPAFAQAPPQRIRGTVTSVAGDVLVVHATNDSDVTFQLAPDTGYRADTVASVDAIKPGSLLAIVSRGPADKQVAVAVRAMAPGMPLRQAILPWDLMPDSTMTNASVAGQSVSAGGHAMTLKSNDQTVEMSIAPDAVIATEATGDRTQLTPGSKVTIFAVPGTGSAMAARVVIIGLDGLVPPV